MFFPGFGILLMVLTVTKCNSRTTRSENSIKMISATRGRFGTSSIIFSASNNKMQSLKVQTFFHGISVDWSRKGVFNVIVDFDHLYKRLEFYKKAINRPLVVIILGSEHESSELQDLTKKMTMNFPIWMIIFQERDKRLCDFCRKPPGNLFRLKWDTEVIVNCCNPTKLEEWWSKNGLSTEVLPLGEIINGKMQWVHNKSIFQRRSEIAQKKIRIVTVKDSISFLLDNGSYSGFLGEVFTELMYMMNFTIYPPIIESQFGNWDTKKSKWTGAVGRVHGGKADLGVDLFVISKRRLNILDFTVPLLTVRNQLYMRKPQFLVPWSAYLKAFRKEIWMLILAIIFFTTILLTLIKYNPRRNRFWPLTVENLLHVWGIFCQQGVSRFPFLNSLRIIYFTVMSMALVLVAAYSSSFISFLSIPFIDLPFSNFEEFSRQTEYRLIILKGNFDLKFFPENRKEMEKKISELLQPKEMLPQNYREVYQQICQEKVVFYGYISSIGSDTSCEIISIASNTIMNYAMILPRYSEYTKLMNHHILQLQNNGMLKRLAEKYSINKKFEPIRGTVNLRMIIPILAFLCGGVLLSLLILFLERKRIASVHRENERIIVRRRQKPDILSERKTRKNKLKSRKKKALPPIFEYCE